MKAICHMCGEVVFDEPTWNGKCSWDIMRMITAADKHKNLVIVESDHTGAKLVYVCDDCK